MNLIPRNWRHQLDDWTRDVGDTFSRWIPQSRPARDDREFWAPFQEFTGAPVIDLEETDREVLVRAELPGMNKDEFNVEVTSDQIILRGEKKKQCEEKDRDYHRVECSYGSFIRSIPLPCEVDSENAQAEYRNGVLEVHMPKIENGKRRKVEVQVR